jgi:hypothetical protein
MGPTHQQPPVGFSVSWGASVWKVRNDIEALELKPGDGVVKVGVAVQLNLFGVNKSERRELIPGTMAAWSSADTRIGEVNRQGRLIPRGAGTVTITATYSDLTAHAVFTVVA